MIKKPAVVALVATLCCPVLVLAAPTECERAKAMRDRAVELRAEIDKTYVIGNAEMINSKTQLAELYERQQKDNEQRCAAEKVQAKLPPPRIGMSAKTVREKTNMGEPESINSMVTAHGTREQWVYADHVYLYFTNGKLTSMQY